MSSRAWNWRSTMPAEPGLMIHVYGAEPASPSADALNLLASWAATSDDGAAAPASARERHPG